MVTSKVYFPSCFMHFLRFFQFRDFDGRRIPKFLDPLIPDFKSDRYENRHHLLVRITYASIFVIHRCCQRIDVGSNWKLCLHAVVFGQRHFQPTCEAYSSWGKWRRTECRHPGRNLHRKVSYPYVNVNITILQVWPFQCRDASCDVQIRLKVVSRKHAIIKQNENGQVPINFLIARHLCLISHIFLWQFVLVHISSTNPSHVNGEAVNGERVLQNNDTVNFGTKVFTFRAPRENFYFMYLIHLFMFGLIVLSYFRTSLAISIALCEAGPSNCEASTNFRNNWWGNQQLCWKCWWRYEHPQIKYWRGRFVWSGSACFAAVFERSHCSSKEEWTIDRSICGNHRYFCQESCC